MRELLRRVWYATRHRRLDDDLAEEIAFHRAMTERHLEADGLDARDAALAARRVLGSGALAHDQARDVWVPRWLQGVAQDLQLAVRQLWSARLTSSVAVLSLALGIGATTAAFSLVNSLLLKPLPVHDPGRLAVLVEPARGGPDDDRGVPIPVRAAVWDEIRRRPTLTDGAIAWSQTSFALGRGGDAHAIDGLWVSDAFFDLLGVSAVAGRTFSAADITRGPIDIAVISHTFWQRQFGGAASAIGQPLTLDGVPFTIVGVTASDFFGPEVGRRFDVAVPLAAEPRLHGTESWLAPETLNSPLRLMVRLRDGQPADAASAALRGVQPQIRAATLPASWPPRFRDQYLKDPFTLARLGDANTVLRQRYGRPLLTIMAVVVLVLLIACGNVANLLLARATARRHDLSVRRALGASRWRIVRQLLSEGAVLAVLATTAGVLFASWASRMLVYRLSTDLNPISLDVSMDARLLAFAIAMAVATILLCGVVPAYRASEIGPAEVLKTRGRASDAARARTAGALVTAQVALSFVLVATSFLLVRTFTTLSARPLGFTPDRVLVVSMSDRHGVVKPEQRTDLYERAAAAVRTMPGVGAAALSAQPAIVTGPMLSQPILQISGRPPFGVERTPLSALNMISTGWFDALGIAFVDGRDFSERDRSGAVPVAIVNQAFARKFLDGGNPIGHTVALALPGPPRPPVEVVGVVSDAVYGTLRMPSQPTIYLPIPQMSEVARPFLTSINLTLRTNGEPPASLVRSVAAAIGGVNPDLTLTFRTLNEQLETSLTQERVLAELSGFFSGAALLLAALGLYGVASYAVTRRRLEIGIRIALGATPSTIVAHVLRRVSGQVAAGIVMGAVVSLWATPLVTSLLYGLQPRDPATLVGAAILLASVATIAAWVPARRAARLDPSVALRAE